jgi:hypothetical protein
MQRDAISAISSVSAKSFEAYVPSDAGSGGAHLTVSAPLVTNQDVQSSLSLRSVESAFKHGMNHSFATGITEKIISASQQGDTPQLMRLSAELMNATNAVGLARRIAEELKQGVRQLTSGNG